MPSFIKDDAVGAKGSALRRSLKCLVTQQVKVNCGLVV